MPRRVFTPAVIKAIRELASQGKSASEIAAAIGSTAASVRVKCCQLKIQLSRRGRPCLAPRRAQACPLHASGRLCRFEAKSGSYAQISG